MRARGIKWVCAWRSSIAAIFAALLSCGAHAEIGPARLPTDPPPSRLGTVHGPPLLRPLAEAPPHKGHGLQPVLLRVRPPAAPPAPLTPPSHLVHASDADQAEALLTRWGPDGMGKLGGLLLYSPHFRPSDPSSSRSAVGQANQIPRETVESHQRRCQRLKALGVHRPWGTITAAAGRKRTQLPHFVHHHHSRTGKHPPRSPRRSHRTPRARRTPRHPCRCLTLAAFSGPLPEKADHSIPRDAREGGVCPDLL